MSASAVAAASEGDVFLIPLGDGSFTVGQVAGAWNDELYLVLYESRISEEQARPDLVADSEPFLAVLSLDAKLWNGDWPVIGNYCANLALLAQPVFRVMQNGQPYVESRDRSVYRPAKGDEFARLQFRSVASPAVVEDAAKAWFGLDEWLPGYDRYSYDYARTSSQGITS